MASQKFIHGMMPYAFSKKCHVQTNLIHPIFHRRFDSNKLVEPTCTWSKLQRSTTLSIRSSWCAARLRHPRLNESCCTRTHYLCSQLLSHLYSMLIHLIQFPASNMMTFKAVSVSSHLQQTSKHVTKYAIFLHTIRNFVF